MYDLPLPSPLPKFLSFQNSSFEFLNAVLNRAKIEPGKLLSVNIKEKYVVLGIDCGDSFLKNYLVLKFRGKTVAFSDSW